MSIVQHIDTMLMRMNKYAYDNKIGNGHRYATTNGKRYTKIIQEDLIGEGRSCVGFIDNTTGAIYKAATWSAPAKGIRGYVNSSTNGDEALNYSSSGLVFVNYAR